MDKCKPLPEALAPPLGRAPRAAEPGRCFKEHVIGIRVDMSLAMCFAGGVVTCLLIVYRCTRGLNVCA